jgi:hypothetical protein
MGLKQQLKAADTVAEVNRLQGVAATFDYASPKTRRQIFRIAMARLARPRPITGKKFNDGKIPVDAPAANADQPRRRRKSFARLGAATLKAKALA